MKNAKKSGKGSYVQHSYGKYVQEAGAARVNIIRRNLLPHIQTLLALQEVDTIPELTRLDRAVKETE